MPLHFVVRLTQSRLWLLEKQQLSLRSVHEMAHLSDFTQRRQADTERFLSELVSTVLDAQVINVAVNPNSNPEFSLYTRR